jgi:hypothetical protein
MSNWESYGPPAVNIGPLEVWVHGRECPDAVDEWDGNWLRVSARHSARGAIVQASGSFLDTVSFVRFAAELRELHQTLSGEASLESLEPELKATLKGKGPCGVLELAIEISPDYPKQTHAFSAEIDQSYIPQIIADCERVIATYPVRHPKARGL